MPVTCSDETLILIYFPGRGSNSQPPAHRSFKHGQGVLRPYPLGHGGGLATCFGRKGRIPLEGVKHARAREREEGGGQRDGWTT